MWRFVIIFGLFKVGVHEFHIFIPRFLVSNRFSTLPWHSFVMLNFPWFHFPFFFNIFFIKFDRWGFSFIIFITRRYFYKYIFKNFLSIPGTKTKILACPFCIWFFYPPPWKLFPASVANPGLDPFTEGLQWLGRNLRLCTLNSTTSQQESIPAEFCQHLRLPSQLLGSELVLATDWGKVSFQGSGFVPPW